MEELMTVKDAANFDVKACSASTDLASAAKIMWDRDCGAVPVVDDNRRVIGMVTDRDICIAAATRASRPSDIEVRDVMSSQVATCHAEDDVHAALKTMQSRQVRRLPVVDGQDRLTGILSMNDLVTHMNFRSGAEGQMFMDALKAVSQHTHFSA
jgi:CBS domain-containing protein